MWGIILGILAFVVLVILHEFGHFTAAKKSGVKVKEFGLGLPPKITTLRTDKSGTEYTLNWIPLGGFVQLKGEDGTDDEENKDPDSFTKAKLWKKLIIVLAGVAMNCLTAWVIFTISFSTGMKPMAVLPEGYMGIYSESYITPTVTFLQEQGFISGDIVDGDVVVESVLEGGAAHSMGLQTGAIIASINGVEITQKNLSSVLQDISNKENNLLTYQYSGEDSQHVGQFDCGEDCKLGIIYNTTVGNYEVKEIKFPVHKAMLVALHEIKAEWNLTMDNLGRIGSLIKNGNAKQAISSLSGPVAIVKVGQVMFESLGFLSFLGFVGMISMALAIMNVLPLPALDGGRFWAIIIQKVFRIKEEKFSVVEGYVNMAFFWLLMIVGVIIMIKDTSFWGVNIPFFN